MVIATTDRRPMTERKACVCLLSAAAVILALGLLCLVLGLTIFKPKRPTTTVDSITVADLDFSVGAKFSVRMDLTLNIGVTVNNPNHFSFKYSNSTAFLKYRGNDVGEVPIPAGEIRPRATSALNLTMTLMADRMLSDSDLYSDVISGASHFEISMRVSGKVRIVFVDVHVVAYSTCGLEIRLATKKLTKKTCHDKVEL